ncbi:MAG: GLUG motif-containing protein, partial [Bradymonadaceae bacterium]
VGEANGTIKQSFSSGTVDASGQAEVGGLAGRTSYAGSLENSYATGDVTGDSQVGGLTGFFDGTSTNSYSTGQVTGNTKTGGLIGKKDSNVTINNSYWNRPPAVSPVATGAPG